jgi:hypothetical protein
MGFFSKSTPASAANAVAGTELPITTTAASSAVAEPAASTAASTAGSTAVTIPDEVVPGRSSKSTPAATTTGPPAKQSSKWHRAASDPPPKSSLSATASGANLAATAAADEAHDAAFEAKYAHLSAAERRKLKELDALARTLDSKFGVGPVKIGYESIIGLVPFAGDAFGAAMGTYVIGNALHMGMPKRLVARMMINVGLDTAVGMVPFVGDIFDFAHKSNSKNIALLKSHMEHPKKATAADTCFLCTTFFCVVVVPCLIFLGVLAGIILLILWLCKVIF